MLAIWILGSLKSDGFCLYSNYDFLRHDIKLSALFAKRQTLIALQLHEFFLIIWRPLDINLAY